MVDGFERAGPHVMVGKGPGGSVGLAADEAANELVSCMSVLFDVVLLVGEVSVDYYVRNGVGTPICVPVDVFPRDSDGECG